MQNGYLVRLVGAPFFLPVDGLSPRHLPKPDKPGHGVHLNFRWAPVLAFQAGISCSQHAVRIPNPSKPRSFKSVSNPALQPAFVPLPIQTTARVSSNISVEILRLANP
jgi:hypothetical protein